MRRDSRVDHAAATLAAVASKSIDLLNVDTLALIHAISQARALGAVPAHVLRDEAAQMQAPCTRPAAGTASPHN